MNDLATTNGNGAPVRTVNPLTSLPGDLIGPAGKFFAFYSDSLKGTAGLVARLLWWMRPVEDGGEGLHVADARKALERLMKPEQAGRSDYAGQVLAALAREVEQLVKDRRDKETNERRRQERDRVAADAAPPDKVREMLQGIGRDVP